MFRYTYVFKSCDLIGYKDSHSDWSKCFKMITWLWISLLLKMSVE